MTDPRKDIGDYPTVRGDPWLLAATVRKTLVDDTVVDATLSDYGTTVLASARRSAQSTTGGEAMTADATGAVLTLSLTGEQTDNLAAATTNDPATVYFDVQFSGGAGGRQTPFKGTIPIYRDITQSAADDTVPPSKYAATIVLPYQPDGTVTIIPTGQAGPAGPPGELAAHPFTVNSLDGDDNITSITIHAPSGDVTTTYTYFPDDGSPTAGAVHTETTNGVTLTYSYDVDGNLTGAA